MPRIPLTGGAYSAASIIANAQRCVNLYPEINPEQNNPPVPITHYPRPGLTALGIPPIVGNTRCLYTATNGDLYQVINSNAYYIDPNWNYTLLGSLLTSATTPVSIADNGTSAIVVDGSLSGNVITLATPAAATSMTIIGDPNFLGGTRVDFLDYFLILNQPATKNWYCTTANSTTFNALYIGVKTAWPDNIIGVCAIERAAWIFGPKKSEIWFNAGALPFPFQIQPGLIIEHGCCAVYSIAKQDVNVYWLSQSPEGARMAMKGTQQTAVRISNHAVEAEWLTYPRVDDCIGTTYQIDGHAFYELHFPVADKTWVFDQSTEQWHEETFIDTNGFPHRHRAPFKTYAYGKNLAADWSNGQLYQLDPNNATDNGQPIACIRSFPHIIAGESQRITAWKLVADMQTGTGISDGSVPLISLRTSRTRGASWGNAITQPLGSAGDYFCRPTWNRLGFFVDGVFELSWAAAMKTALNSVFLTFENHDGDL